MMPGKKAGFRDAEQKAHHVEHGRRGDEHGQHGDHAPRDHDPRDPHSRAHLVKDHIARNLKEEIADEENARAKAINRIAQAEVARHLQLRKADVHAVQIRDHVAEHQERREPPVDLAIGRLFESGRRRARAGMVERICGTSHGVSSFLVELKCRVD